MNIGVLSNAVKYTKTGGVTVQVGCTGTKSEPNREYGDAKYAFITIKDTGIGLYLCKSILDKLGHRLLVTSTEGVGTRVEILIAEN